jgi:hypothetical protein
MYSHTLAIALSTRFNIVWVVTSAATTMGTDNLSIVRDFKRLALIQLFKYELNFDAYTRSSLFLLLTKAMCYASKMGIF